jgi:UDP-N-acetylmuramate--L-alanine ligase/undecaprenyldiphospho-muramoylpentapeptide beta-N-acetylglucosaminyltransferase/UDP-N-acetylenolpyruvoylglucosamine reductase
MKLPASTPLVAIACGGTGGHLFPGIAVGKALLERGCAVTLLVSRKAVDQQAAGSVTDMEVVTLPAAAMTRGRLVGFLAGFWRAYRTAMQHFRSHPPDAVLAMGGFTSAPPVLAGKHRKAATFLHEANTVPGRANRWLAPWVDQAFVSFPQAASRLRHTSVAITGTPVRPQFQAMDQASCRLALGLDPELPTLLVVGGSQGAAGINDLVIRALPILKSLAPTLQFLHLSGPDDVAKARAAYAAYDRKAVVCPFLTEMEYALGAADAAVSRAGASSLAEFAAMQVPPVLVPYPSAADNHQFHNARAFVETGAARMLDQCHATPQALAALVIGLVQNEEAAAEVRRALKQWHAPHAAQLVAERILSGIRELQHGRTAKGCDARSGNSPAENGLPPAKRSYGGALGGAAGGRPTDCLTPQEASDLLEKAGPGSVVHLVGAGGCGMSGLGHLLLDLGHAVTGSDLVLNQEVCQLRARGANIHIGHECGRVEAMRPVLVVYSSAIPAANPELQEARRVGIPTVRRGILLAALLRRQRGICVVGMHGKSTTASLLAYALERLGVPVSYAVGAQVPQLSPHARFVSAQGAASQCQPWFVIEADESDGTLSEFDPEHAVVLNVDEEHLDFYPNLDAVCHEFRRFAERTHGKVVFCADDPVLAELFSRRPETVSYGFNPLAVYRIEMRSVVAGRSMPDLASTHRFVIWFSGKSLGEFETQLIGEKNLSNAGAVVSMLHELGFDAARIARAVAPFTGAARRQEELFRDARYRVFDDYAHHPTEIRATLQALKQLGARRLLVAFQPHRYTRTRLLLSQFATCFAAADQLWITEVYAASEPEIPGVNGALLADAVRVHGQPVSFITSLAELRQAVREAMKPGDLVVFLGAGDISQVAHQLAEELRQETRHDHEQLLGDLMRLLSPNAVVRCNESMAKHTTLRVGGPADFYVEPASEADLAAVLQFCRAERLPFLLLGRGSNLLVRDGGIRGVVIHLVHAAFSRIEVVGERLFCGAGVRLKAVVAEAGRHGISGLEFLEGIPASVGGALRMNAGAMGSSIFDVVESIRFMDYNGQVFERNAGAVSVEYRGCPLLKDHVALSAVFKGRNAPKETIEERLRTFSQVRWHSQPAAPSAGCIFKNPGTIPAGRLIDELGLKGTRVGGAAVSEVHANFIVNVAEATATDILRLMDIIRQRAKAVRGVDLEPEVEIVGEDICLSH